MAIVASALWARGEAFAQGGTLGSIIGTVIDQNGSPIKGVKISARSDAQIGGAKTAYTDQDGFFRIPGLQPGEFELTATAPKLRTVLQKGIPVGINAPAQVDVVMEVETTTEEVVVVQKAPIVSTTTANVKQSFDAEFVMNLPNEQRTAAEGFVGDNTAGGASRDPRNIRLSGGSTSQSQFTIDGFNTNAIPVNMNSFAAFDVQTGGYGADGATAAGGVVNMVTKSGSNKTEFEINGYHENSKLQFFKDSTDSRVFSHNTVVNGIVSGPIVRDRLWYYLNVEANANIEARDKDPTGIVPNADLYPRRSFGPRGQLKLTWQLTPRNKLQLVSILNRSYFRNNTSSVNSTPEAQETRDFFEHLNGLTWESLLTDSMLFKSQVAYSALIGQFLPQSCLDAPDECGHIPQLRQTFPRSYNFNNRDFMRQTTSASMEFINTLEWFKNTASLGDHSVRAKVRFQRKVWEDAESTAGEYYDIFNGSVPDRRVRFFSNDPRLEEGRGGFRITNSTSQSMVASLQDSVRMGRRLTVTPGVAFTRTTSTLQGQPAGLDMQGMTPHLAAAWDPMGDGRTVVRGSYNHYLDTGDATTREPNLQVRFRSGGRVSQNCQWNDVSGQFDRNCTYSGGASNRTVGLPCGPTGLRADGSSCATKIVVPRTYEYTLGAEREIVQGISLAGDLVYRFYNNQFEDFETNRVWNTAGTGLDPVASFRNGRSETVEDLGTPDSADRRYIGFTTALNKQEGRFKLKTAYTWSSLMGRSDKNPNWAGTVDDTGFGSNPVTDQYYLWGYLQDDSRHALKTSMTYSMTEWLNFGFIHRYYSGRPYSRRFRNDVLGSFTDYRASVGIDPGANPNDPGDDRPARLPDRQEFNAQMRVNFRPLIGQNLEAWVDVINVLALRTVTGVQTQDGPTFGSTTGRMGPTRARIGLRYRF